MAPTIAVFAPGASSVERKFVPVGWTSVKLVRSSIFRSAPSSLDETWNAWTQRVQKSIPIVIIIGRNWILGDPKCTRSYPLGAWILHVLRLWACWSFSPQSAHIYRYIRIGSDDSHPFVVMSSNDTAQACDWIWLSHNNELGGKRWSKMWEQACPSL